MPIDLINLIGMKNYKESKFSEQNSYFQRYGQRKPQYIERESVNYQNKKGLD